MENQMMIRNDDTGISASLNARSEMFCSLPATTREEKAALFNAMSNPDERLGDHINEIILIKDVFAETIQLTNEETGEIQNVPRIVLIAADGTSYAATSTGIFSALKRVFQLFGTPTWEEPIPVKVLQVTRKERKLLTLAIAENDSKK